MHALCRFCQKNSYSRNRLIARKIRLLRRRSYRWIAKLICQFFGHRQSVGNRIRSVAEGFFGLRNYLYGQPCCDALGSRGSHGLSDAISPDYSWRQPILRVIDTMAEALVGVPGAWISYEVRPRQERGGLKNAACEGYGRHKPADAAIVRAGSPCTRVHVAGHPRN
jgi:hypothetical protein